MNTILTDRLWSDPRLRDLSDRLRCSLKALGLLSSIWHGTQNLGAVYAAKQQLLNSLPAGTRRDPRLIDALVASGWLVVHGEMFEVVGNADHVQARESMSERGKKGAAKRWGAEDASSISPGMAEANASEMPSLPPSQSPLPPSSPRKASKVKRNPEDDPAAEVIREHRRLLAAKGVNTSDKITESSLINARKVLKEWPEQWRDVLQLLTTTNSDWLKQHRWPLSSVIRYADDYDERLRNAKPSKANAQAEHIRKAAELEAQYAAEREAVEQRNREEDERAARGES